MAMSVWAVALTPRSRAWTPGSSLRLMREDVEERDGTAHFGTRPAVGENIRRAGEDVALQTTLLDAGCLLRWFAGRKWSCDRDGLWC